MPLLDRSSPAGQRSGVDLRLALGLLLRSRRSVGTGALTAALGLVMIITVVMLLAPALTSLPHLFDRESKVADPADLPAGSPVPRASDDGGSGGPGGGGPSLGMVGAAGAALVVAGCTVRFACTRAVR